jgi:hypothetical protein
MRHLTPTAQRASRKINEDMGDAPDEGIVFTVITKTGEAVRVERLTGDRDMFIGSSRTLFAEDCDGWIDDRDEAGLRPLYEFDRFALFDEPQIEGAE